MHYGMSKPVNGSYDETVTRVTEELKKEGFGVLTTIDVRDTLKKKLDVDFDRYVILGACNPPFAHRALKADEDIGLLLPCNVVVHEKEGKTKLSIFDPLVMASLTDNAELTEVATEVRKRLDRVLERM